MNLIDCGSFHSGRGFYSCLPASIPFISDFLYARVAVVCDVWLFFFFFLRKNLIIIMRLKMRLQMNLIVISMMM